MRITSYLSRQVLASVAMVMMVLMALTALFTFIGQQDDVGIGTYRSGDAFWFALFNLPQQMFELLPIGALIGSLIGMGALARGSEITVLRAAGMSVWSLARSILPAALVLLGMAVLLGEYIAPPLVQVAKQQKAFAKFSNISFAGRGGAWLREPSRIINVTQQSTADSFSGVAIFELDQQGRLKSMATAASAAAGSPGYWDLGSYAVTTFAGETVNAEREQRYRLATGSSGELLGLTVREPWQLPNRSLWKLIHHLRANGLDAGQTIFAFWSRIARSVAIVFAVLLAVPLVVGVLRSAGSGSRTVVGMLLGIAFFMLQNLLESGTIVFDLNPVLLAWLPAALLAGASLIAILRAR
ncbi:MAG: LPS export ABC transporter permease LptG [Steroidobacteraceae bacterium]